MRDFIGKVNDTAPLATGVLDAAEDNVRFEELETAVTASGITLDAATGPDTRTNMLAESMTRHVGAALACSDSGSANAYVLTMIGSYVAPATLITELRVRFRPGHANTGASTVNFEGLGSKPLVDHALSPLSGGELESGREAEVMYRADVGASGSWVLPAWANALYVDPSPAAPTEIGDGEGWSVDTGDNTGNLNFAGLVNSATLAATDIFARHVDGVGHKGITGAQLLAALGGGSGLVGVQLLRTSGVYTKNTNATRVMIVAFGGGGAGGSNNAQGTGTSGGGGAGAGIFAYIDLTGVATVSVSMGVGGAPSLGGNGGDGGATYFGAYASAFGGKGGRIRGGTTSYGGGGRGGLAGTASGCIEAHAWNGEAGGAGGAFEGGAGGSTWFGGGGAGGDDVGGRTNGDPGGGYGAGGGGADIGLGGAGQPGCILVLEFA